MLRTTRSEPSPMSEMRFSCPSTSVKHASSMMVYFNMARSNARVSCRSVISSRSSLSRITTHGVSTTRPRSSATTVRLALPGVSDAKSLVVIRCSRSRASGPSWRYNPDGDLSTKPPRAVRNASYSLATPLGVTSAVETAMKRAYHARRQLNCE